MYNASRFPVHCLKKKKKGRAFGMCDLRLPNLKYHSRAETQRRQDKKRPEKTEPCTYHEVHGENQKNGTCRSFFIFLRFSLQPTSFNCRLAAPVLFFLVFAYWRNRLLTTNPIPARSTSMNIHADEDLFPENAHPSLSPSPSPKPLSSS